MAANRLLPQALEMERLILGALLIEPAVAEKLTNRLRATDFYKTAHRNIYESAMMVWRRRKTVDVKLVAMSLDNAGRLDASGGLDYLGTLAADVPSSANVEAYAEAVIRASVARELIATATRTQEDAYSGGLDIAEVANNAAKLLQAMVKRLEGQGRVPAPSAMASQLPGEFAAEAAGKRGAIPLCWTNVDLATKMLRPRSVTVLGGPPGWGKSLLALCLLMSLPAGTSWALLPLEGSRSDWERRALAYMAQQWWVLDSDQVRAAERTNLLEQYKADLETAAANVCDNPLIESEEHLDYHEVLDWIKRMGQDRRVVVVDNLSFISFPAKQQWAAQDEFIRILTKLAAKADNSMVLLAHTIKGAGKGKGNPLSAENLAGSAMLHRAVDNVLLLERHEPKLSQVVDFTSTKQIQHDRTLLIEKTRNAMGGIRIAMTLKDCRFEDLGVLVPAKRRGQ